MLMQSLSQTHPSNALAALCIVVLSVVSAGCFTSPSGSASAVGGPQGRIPQFVVACELSHIAPDDPIVVPGRPGASHVHTFFGASGVHASSTYESLLASDTTCDQKLDTASYWAPALLANDRIVEPAGLRAYYRPGPDIDPVTVQPYPPGLMLIAGDATARGPQPVERVGFSCGDGGTRQPNAPNCDDGHPLTLTVVFPDCWDGERTDSPSHTEHSAYSSNGACPAGHPVAIPQLLLAMEYPYEGPSDALALASGPLYTAHADFWNGWDQDKLVTEVTLCINRSLVCGVHN